VPGAHAFAFFANEWGECSFFRSKLLICTLQVVKPTRLGVLKSEPALPPSRSLHSARCAWLLFGRYDNFVQFIARRVPHSNFALFAKLECVTAPPPRSNSCSFLGTSQQGEPASNTDETEPLGPKMRSFCKRAASTTNAAFVCILILAATTGCSLSSAGGPRPPAPPVPSGSVPEFGHVVLVVEENHSYSEVVGNSAMPYLNSLASQYGLATQYFANTHPSIGDYFMLTTGQLVTRDDGFTDTVGVDNIVRQLIAAGKTWKSYAESIPSTGYTGNDSYPYSKRHNPFAYFIDVVNSSTQSNNLVSLSQFHSDLSNGQLPNFSFLVPNLLDDAHDGSLQLADAWLQSNIAPLISSPAFQKDGLLIITFDEAEINDSTHGGGRIAAFIISPKARQGYRSTALYQHQSTLRLILRGLGIQTYPAAASTAPEMSEFF
jgi:hypothetical protein